MPVDGPIPGWLLSGAAVATVFTVMFDLGLAIVPGDFRRAWQHPGQMLKGLFSVLIVVPAVALAVTRMFDLARTVEIGIVLMAISPGAPVALRRSLNAGGRPRFRAGVTDCGGDAGSGFDATVDRGAERSL